MTLRGLPMVMRRPTQCEMAESEQVSGVIRRRGLQTDEFGMTAVIEFLSAFVLFLVIVSAFLSLSQLHLGPNQPIVDRLDEDAVNGLMRLTSTPGWFVPQDENGTRDTSNGTANWHLHSASELANGDVLPGLTKSDGSLDINRLLALSNITEKKMQISLGLPESTTLNLTIRVVESSDSERIGFELFSDGTSRSSATRSSISSRLMPLGDEIIRLSLEVLQAGKNPASLRITEFLPDPDNGGPEWVEVYNDPGFAVEILGYGLARNGLYNLVGEGFLSGDSIMLLTGDIDNQPQGNASIIIDLSYDGLLGRGSLDGLKVPIDTLRLTFNEYGSAKTMDVHVIRFDASWGFDSDESASWTGNNTIPWIINNNSTPGDI